VAMPFLRTVQQRCKLAVITGLPCMSHFFNLFLLNICRATIPRGRILPNSSHATAMITCLVS